MHLAIEPVWQNYSSMYREAITARDAKTGMEVAHHRMAALYFGIAALESFLNLKMRDHLLRAGKDHDEIHGVLRKGKLKDKIKEWPVLVTGAELGLRPDSIGRVLSINALRGDLTHQKNLWPEAYEELSTTDPMDLVDLVAEFVVEFHRAGNEFFPYWVWGWNYLSPQRDAPEIALLNNTQVMHSLSYLGYKFEPSTVLRFEDRQRRILADYAGYLDVARFLRGCDRCEPKIDRFPHQPKLCRRWWDPVHQGTCGNVSDEALWRALEIDAQYGQPRRRPERNPEQPAAIHKAVRALLRVLGRD